ncbi:chain-length determining protein [Brevundimonas olei]|uniref:chain-length determining protein n=1 Tax=Brevundimonas olei TaxID=657642 RepID=UPI0031D39F7B
MSEQLRYIGPLSDRPETRPSRWEGLRRRAIAPFSLVVIAPTLLASLYWGVIATPQYVSESHFMVRKTDEARPNSLGLVLQGVGLSGGTEDSFAVQEFMLSRDAAGTLDKRFDLEKVFTRNGADLFSRYPGLFDRPSEEARFRTLKRFVTVGYNSTSGITTLRVQAFTPQDARNMNLALLASGEALVNRLNERAATNAVAEARAAVEEASLRRATIQDEMAAFRNRERFLDPQIAATESTQLISGLLTTVAQLRAEMAQLRQTAPESPQIPILSGRISAYEAQIAAERDKLTGEASSLVRKMSTYEGLALQRELADRAVMEASASLMTAQQDARRQKLYLDRVVEPNLADKPIRPERLRAILIVFLSSLVIYFLGRLLWGGLREHRQE